MSPEERKALIAELAEVLHSASPQLSKEEQQWVRLAIQKEAQSLAFRKAIIEKTLMGVIWFFICGVGYVFVDFLKNHGLKV